MPFQRLSGRLNYHITQCRQEAIELECRRVGDKSGRESHHPAEGALGAPSSFGDPLVTRCGRESQHSAESRAPGPPVEQQENEKDNADGHKSGVQYIAVFVRSPTPSHTQPFK